MVNENEITEETIETQEPTSSEGTQPQVEPNGDSGQPAVEPQGRRHDNTVPYKRFEKVNEELKALKAQQETAVQSLTGGQETNQVQDDNLEPQREQFQSDADYYKAMGQYGGRQGFMDAQAKQDAEQRQLAENQRLEEANNNFTNKFSEAKSKYNNFEQALNNSSVEFKDPEVQLAIMESPVAGDLAYALATNPEKAAEIANAPRSEALVKLGQLSAQLPGSNGQPMKMPNMPNPIQAVGTGKPNASKPYDDDMDQSSFNDSFPFEDLE